MSTAPRWRWRRALRWVAALALLAGTAMLPAPAAPQEDPAVPPELRLVDQSGPVAPGRTFRVAVVVPDELEASDVLVRFHRPVNGRIQFEASVSGERLGSVVHTADAVPVRAGGATVRVPFGGDGPDVASFSREGVYPVSVQARDEAGTVVGQLVTHVIVLPPTTDTSPPLLVAPVVRVGASPALQPDGSVNFEDDELAAVRVTVTALAARPAVPVTLEVVPETMLALERSTDPATRRLLDDLIENRTGRPLLRAPFVRLDEGAWRADGLVDELETQHTAGRAVLARLLGPPRDDTSGLVDEATSAPELAGMLERGVRALVPTGGWQAPVDGDPLRGPLALGSSSEVVVVQTDTAIRAGLADTDQPVLAAHRTIAALMVHYFELPGTQRGEALVVPDELAGAPGFLGALLNGLEVADRLKPVTVTQLVNRLQPTESQPGVEPDLAAPASTGTLRDDLDAARQAGAAFASTFTDGAAPSLNEAFLVASSGDLSPDQRARYLRSADVALAELAEAVRVPEGQTVTLTARTADIPLVVENALARPVRVRLVVQSDKLEFPDGSSRIVDLAPGVNHLEVGVRTRASGAFPLNVQVQTPERALDLAIARMNIRSTAISGIGLVLSIGAGIFLVVWWARHWRSARRSRRLVSTAHPVLGTFAEPLDLLPDAESDDGEIEPT